MVKVHRYLELDAFRGIAILLVMISHYTWAYDFHFNTLDQHSFHFPFAGELGVKFFFIISGFVIFLSLKNLSNVKDFLINRFSRLYPTYWICLLITLLFILIFPVPSINYTFYEILANFSMVQGYLKIKHIDQVYWSLGIELVFYGLMALIFKLKLIKHINAISFLWLLLVLLSLINKSFFFKILTSALILRYAPLFIMGIMFYKLKNNSRDFFIHFIILFSYLLTVYRMYDEGIVNPQYPLLNISFVFFTIVVILFYYFSYFSISFFQSGFLNFIGKISYPLYLLHNVIGYSIIFRIKKLYDVEIVYVVCTSVVTIFMAFLISTHIENSSTISTKIFLKRYFK